MSKNRSRVRAQRAKAVAGKANPKPWWQRTWVIVVAIAGALGSILGAPTLINQFVEESAKLPDTFERVEKWTSVDSRYTGQWTNDLEGDVGTPLEGLELTPKPERRVDVGGVSFDFILQDGELAGEATSRSIREHLPWSHLMVSGGMIGEKLRVHVWDFKGGTPTVFARLDGTYRNIEGNEQLEFTTIDGEYLFPAKFVVWRGPMPEASANPNWDKMVRKAINEVQKGKSSTAP